MTETADVPFAPTVNQAQAELHAALAAAQGEFPPVAREKTVTVQTRSGPSYTFSYAPLDVILNAVRPVLSAHGLALVQRLEAPGGVPAIRTELLHASGGVLAASFPLGPAPDSPQALGSLLTYLRRYAVVSLLGIAAEEDDDGRQAAGHTPAGQAAGPGADTAATSGPAAAPSQFQPPAEFRPDDQDAYPLTEPQRKKIYALRTKLLKAGAFTEEDWQGVMSGQYGTEHVSELTRQQASTLIERLVAKESELDA